METVPRIAALQGSTGAVAQRIFHALVERWRSDYRIAGVLEEGYGLLDRMRGAGYLQSVSDERRFPIFQALGAGSAACQVDERGATEACSALQQKIAAGCDLLILSKFGRLESDGRGLLPALFSALDSNVPVVIYVPAKFEERWRQVADPLFVSLPAQADAIDDWWAKVRPATTWASLHPDRRRETSR